MWTHTENESNGSSRLCLSPNHANRYLDGRWRSIKVPTPQSTSTTPQPTNQVKHPSPKSARLIVIQTSRNGPRKHLVLSQERCQVWQRTARVVREANSFHLLNSINVLTNPRQSRYGREGQRSDSQVWAQYVASSVQREGRGYGVEEGELSTCPLLKGAALLMMGSSSIDELAEPTREVAKSRPAGFASKGFCLLTLFEKGVSLT